MDIVEFAEKTLGLELLDFQKKHLKAMYDFYKEDPNHFNNLSYPRGSARFNTRPLYSVMFSLFDKEVNNECSRSNISVS